MDNNGGGERDQWPDNGGGERDQWTIMEEVKVLHMIQALLAQAEETCLQMRAPAMRESRGAKD